MIELHIERLPTLNDESISEPLGCEYKYISINDNVLTNEI